MIIGLSADSPICLYWMCVFVPWFLFPPWVLEECDSYVNCLLYLLSWCWRVRHWDELGKERLNGKMFVIPWGWSQGGKGDYSKLPDIQLRMKLWVGDGSQDY